MTNSQINEIINKMTLEDKIALCSGENFWETKKYEKYGIPSLFMSDGPHGLRKQGSGMGTDMLGINESEPATCFPAEVTTGASWDTELLEKIGAAIGREARSLGVGLVLGPGANMKRNPLCGRNFEYFSEDPYLAGKMAAAFIKGVEAQGVGTSLKHFACNSQELSRFTSDSIVDQRTLREIYLTAFETAVKEGKPSTVMCAYPKLNGIHCSDNKELLADILRKDWGFEGMVVTDWGAMNDRIKGFEAGCDLSMPGGSGYMEKDVAFAAQKGTLSEEKINESAKRILKLVFRAKETLEESCARGEKTGSFAEENHKLAVEAACKGAILLKNEDNVLPLKQGKIAIVGNMAKNMRYQGAGSSHINPTKLSNPIEYFYDCDFAEGYDDKGATNETMLSKVTEVAEHAEKVIVFAGLPGNYESEGFDRANMKMPEGHLKVIETAAKANKNVILVLFAGAPVECPWADLDSVKAILYMGLPGQGGGEAVWKLLTGIVNPSGKLTETWPVKYEDVPSSEIYGKKNDALYQEGIYIGYRYYEKAGLPVRWQFGYGLSYTTFEYSNLKVDGRKISVKVTNTGSVSGEEAVLLFVGKEQEGIHRPIRELKQFCKLSLEPGETKTASFELDDRCFSIWSNGGWVIEEGDYTVWIGNHTDGLKGTHYEEGKKLNELDDDWYKTLSGKPDYASFEKALGHPYKESVLKKGHFTMDNTVAEMKDHSLMMKIMYKATEKTIAKQFGGKPDYENPDFRMMMNASVGGPLRNMKISSGMQGELFEGLLDIANGHLFKGLSRLGKK